MSPPETLETLPQPPPARKLRRERAPAPRLKREISIRAFQASGRRTFVVNFVHPFTGERVSRSLQTRDSTLARQIALDLERLARNAELWALHEKDPHAPEFLAYQPRAVEVFCGQRLGAAPATALLAPEQRQVLEALTQSGLMRHVGSIALGSEELAEERRRRVENEKKLHDLAREKAMLEEELATLRRRLNLHVSVTLGEALGQFRRIYPQGRSEGTVRDVVGTVESFLGKVGPDLNLGRLRAHEIDRWLREARRVDNGGDLSPLTRKRLKANLSIFLTWACREYDLAENVMLKAAPIPGVARHPEQILAIRRLEDLRALFEALRPWPYWRACVATAILAGPRWSEQVWLKKEDVFLEDGYLRITTRTSGRRVQGTKTGRERNVPLERTLLIPALREHLARLDSPHPWVFPSLQLDGNPRTKTPPGIWSSSTGFHHAWKGIAEAARESAGGEGEFWSYGPAEWRHSFGTALAQCGFTTLEISKLMGNSPSIAERYYIGLRAEDAGRRWPFRWT
jgi:integrase